MSPLKLTYAGLLYLDRTLALLTKQVVPEGVELDYEVFPTVEELFRRQAQDAEFAVSEMSLAAYSALVSRGNLELVALPVFLSRHFRHREIYVRADSGISEPKHLKGKRIGLPHYEMTAAVWVRGLFEHEYGVPSADIQWYEGAIRTPHTYKQRLQITLPDGVHRTILEPADTLEAMLADGRIDGLVTTETPRLGAHQGEIVRLFPDWGTDERGYFGRTGIFPIMHTLVVNRRIAEQNPWLAGSLFAAFCAAKQVGQEGLRFQSSLPVCLPWIEEDIIEVDELFGGDCFPYGVEANRATLEAFLQYMHEQGLTDRPVGVDELFLSV